MQVAPRLIRFDFNQAAYLAALNQTLQLELRHAAQAWLRAVLTRVPVWSGQARGSLQPLGRFIQVAVPNAPTARINRVALGESQQMFQFTQANALHMFRWETHVPHYLINEYYNVPLPLINPTPWLSLDAGEAAFMAYAATIQLPQISDHIIGVVL